MTREEAILKRRETARLWNAANKDRVKANRAKYREKNAEELALKQKGAYAKNPEAYKAAQKKFHSENPWYNSFLCARARCQNPKNPRFYRYGGRGIQFLLTVEDTRMLWFRDKAELLVNPSIDRIDNDGPYSVENCRWIEKTENGKRARSPRTPRAERLRQQAEAHDAPLDPERRPAFEIGQLMGQSPILARDPSIF
jgi:hypothetical protein